MRTFSFPLCTYRFFVLCLLSFGLSPAIAEPLVIKFSHVVSDNTPKGRMAQKFQELVERRLSGAVVVEIYPNASLYGDSQVIDALLRGEVHIAAPSLSKFGNYTDLLKLYDLPFLFKDLAAAERFQQSPMGNELLRKALRNEGLYGLGYLHNGMKQLSANRSITLPSDAAGLTFRIQNSDILRAQFGQMGASAVVLPFSKVHQALADGVIDGQENTWSNIYTKRFYEEQTHILESNHGLLDYLVVTSTEFWYRLPPDVRKILNQSLRDAIAYGNILAFDIAEQHRQAVLDSGETVIQNLSDEERQQWVELMQPLWYSFESIIGKQYLDAAIAANR